MTKTVRARYTLEFKQEAVRLVTGGQSIAAAARSLGVVEQTLFNWVKADRQGRLKGADSKVVSAEQMEISRLRAELAHVKMERDILGKVVFSFHNFSPLSLWLCGPKLNAVYRLAWCTPLSAVLLVNSSPPTPSVAHPLRCHPQAPVPCRPANKLRPLRSSRHASTDCWRLLRPAASLTLPRCRPPVAGAGPRRGPVPAGCPSRRAGGRCRASGETPGRRRCCSQRRASSVRR
jgi:transposase